MLKARGASQPWRRGGAPRPARTGRQALETSACFIPHPRPRPHLHKRRQRHTEQDELQERGSCSYALSQHHLTSRAAVKDGGRRANFADAPSEPAFRAISCGARNLFAVFGAPPRSARVEPEARAAGVQPGAAMAKSEARSGTASPRYFDLGPGAPTTGAGAGLGEAPRRSETRIGAAPGLTGGPMLQCNLRNGRGL